MLYLRLLSLAYRATPGWFRAMSGSAALAVSGQVAAELGLTGRFVTAFFATGALLVVCAGQGIMSIPSRVMPVHTYRSRSTDSAPSGALGLVGSTSTVLHLGNARGLALGQHAPDGRYPPNPLPRYTSHAGW